MALQKLMTGGLFQFGEQIIKRIWPDPAEQEKALLALRDLEQKGDLAQLAVNLREAQHESLFVAGWRPFVGWVCAGAFAYAFVLQPFLIFISTLWGHDLSALPDLNIGTMMPVLMGMLGLGWMRTHEKKTGANKNR